MAQKRMTLEELRKLREEKKHSVAVRDTDSKSVEVTVGMGTSGIAAGAKETLKTLVAELEKHQLTHVAVRQSGGLGLEHAEPTMEVRMPDMPTVIYGQVTPEVVRRIVSHHIIGHELVDEHIFDRPAADILDAGDHPIVDGE